MQEDGFVPSESSSKGLSNGEEAKKEEDPIYEYARTQHLYAEGMYFLYSHTVLKDQQNFSREKCPFKKL